MRASAIGTTVPVSMVLWHREARDEADGVEDGDEECDVGGEPIEKRYEPAHGTVQFLADRLGLGHGFVFSGPLRSRRDRNLDAQNAEGASARLCPAVDLSLRLS